MSKLHYIQCYLAAREAGFIHFSEAIRCLYFAEWGEVMPGAAVRKGDALTINSIRR